MSISLSQSVFGFTVTPGSQDIYGLSGSRIISTTKQKFTHALDTHVYEINNGELFIAPNRHHRIQSGGLIVSSVEGYNILTNGITLCSQITRLTLERLTGKLSGVGRSGDIVQGDAITLIYQGKNRGGLRTIGVLSGSLTGINTITGLIATLKKYTHKSSYMLRDMYLQHTSSYGFNQGHRFILMRGSDKQNYIIDPVLGSGHAYPKPLSDYLTSIWSIKQGGTVYVGKGYMPTP